VQLTTTYDANTDTIQNQLKINEKPMR